MNATISKANDLEKRLVSFAATIAFENGSVGRSVI
jgi:hypothetical protein